MRGHINVPFVPANNNDSEAESCVNVAFTLLASAWNNGTQTVVVTGVTPEINGILSLGQGYTDAQEEAVAKADFSFTQGTDSMTFTCGGEVPTIDIPMQVMIGTVLSGMNFGDMQMSVYDPNGKRTDIFDYVDKALEDFEALPEGSEGQMVGYDKNGKPVALPIPDAGDSLPEGESGQILGFDEEGNVVSMEMPKADGLKPAFFATIGTNWTEDENTGVKTQRVAVAGMSAKYHVSIDNVMTHDRTSDGYAAFVEEQNQLLDFITNGDAETVDGAVVFYIFADPNTVEIPVIITVEAVDE